MFRRAITRRPGAHFASGLTSVNLGAPSVALALEQHAGYCEALRRCGLEVMVLEPDARFPDSTFVEDAAVVAGTRAVLTRPGAESRAGEPESIRAVLQGFFEHLDEIVAPGTLDGGDVLEAGSHYYVGISTRTNRDGAEQLAAFLRPLGLGVSFVDIRDMATMLHLKSGVAYLGDGVFLSRMDLLTRLDVRGDAVIRVPAGEEYAANCIRVNDVVVLPAGHAQVEALLAKRGYRTVAVAMSEFRKMDGGLSCLSLRF
ncbi:MAG TPA: hypothetical protein VGN11_09085 [Candidatus Baltobacteraceae bacterium]|nr:hypothetical protein [Candidatus Baltobacteraceae bacterium]